MSPTRRPRDGPAACSRRGRRSGRPGRTSAPLASASSPASGEACTPAAQIFVRASMRSAVPSGVRRSTPNASTPVTDVLVRIVTPRRPSSPRGLLAGAGRRTRPGSPGHRRRARRWASVGSMRRKLRESAAGQLGDLTGDLDAGRTAADDDEGQPGLARLGIVLALGHLEGAEDPPAQLQGVVDRLHARARSGRTRRGRSTTARRRRPRSGCRTRRCGRVSSGRCAVTVRDGQVDLASPWPSRRVTLRWRRRTSRIGGATSPSDRMPVATW